MAKSIMGACKSGRCERLQRSACVGNKAAIPSRVHFFSRIVDPPPHCLSQTPKSKAKQSCTYRLELVRRTRLVVQLCADTAAPKKSQKRQTTCCSADERVPRRRREPKHRIQEIQEKSVYEITITAVCSAAGSGITQSQGSMSRPILRSAYNVQERSARESDRPCVLVERKYINECGCRRFRRPV